MLLQPAADFVAAERHPHSLRTVTLDERLAGAPRKEDFAWWRLRRVERPRIGVRHSIIMVAESVTLALQALAEHERDILVWGALRWSLSLRSPRLDSAAALEVEVGLQLLAGTACEFGGLRAVCREH